MDAHITWFLLASWYPEEGYDHPWGSRSRVVLQVSHWLRSTPVLVDAADAGSSALAEDRWTEIEEPFGKTIHALELIQGWHTKRLLYSVIAAAIPDVLVVAIITVTTKSLQSGLAAGSYTVGLQALFLAMLAMLGIVLA